MRSGKFVEEIADYRLQCKINITAKILSCGQRTLSTVKANLDEIFRIFTSNSLQLQAIKFTQNLILVLSQTRLFVYFNYFYYLLFHSRMGWGGRRGSAGELSFIPSPTTSAYQPLNIVNHSLPGQSSPVPTTRPMQSWLI